MAVVFEWAIAIYDLELDAVRRGEKSRARARQEIVALLRKARGQLLKDYALFPALAGRRGAHRALTGNVVANLVRNLWVHTVVFCGHIPESADTFTEEQYRDETRGGWYRRQLLGSCNLEGTRLFHLLTGNLSFQIEHHLFPDLPSNRYAEIAPQVRAVCERHGLPYNSGRLGRQYRSVYRQVLRLAFPALPGYRSSCSSARFGATDGRESVPSQLTSKMSAGRTDFVRGSQRTGGEAAAPAKRAAKVVA
jgi:linoleoyl-CoA desaturase